MNLGIKWLLAPFFVALGIGITLLWVDRPSSLDGNDANTQRIPVWNENQSTDVGLEQESSDTADSD